ncbi:hypothetical protein GCM10008090_22060 [Arenicella chitinivorans]|uniref:Uncharacterized protein n=1 Tax=Arenicella chitinivorans TaxID=1329800 RepID=A0A918RUQ3_9GAMM|nr:hypothetical protein [Arenicella chitinivorans]GHA11851.1 hypothetical protein GCM10008090_22060 [Arenicella chitinivorans]
MQKLFHINDNRLQLQSDRVVDLGQGYAWLKGDQVLFDERDDMSPVRACRLTPQEINNRYWQLCDQSAIPANDAGMRHTADLIWKHLTTLHQAHDLDEVTLVVPSHYHETNLQLLLGIAQSCGVGVKAMVNKAVLALCGKTDGPGMYRHIDVQLHQTVISHLQAVDGNLLLTSVDVISDVGMHLIQEALLQGLQTRFIQSDRFDPLHNAQTEQQLFDQLADIAIQVGGAGKANVALDHQGQLHATSIEAQEWDALLAPFMQRVLTVASQADAVSVFVDLNGMFEHAVPTMLLESGVRVVKKLPAIPRALQSLTRDDEPSYLAELPCRVADAGTSSSAADTRAPSRDVTHEATDVTHILSAGCAIPMHRAHVAAKSNALIVRQGEPNVAQLLAQGSLSILNDEARKELRPNDRLGSNLADGVLTAIRVLE